MPVPAISIDTDVYGSDRIHRHQAERATRRAESDQRVTKRPERPARSSSRRRAHFTRRRPSCAVACRCAESMAPSTSPASKRRPIHRTAATEVADRCAGMSRRLCWSAHGRLRCTMQPFDIHVQNQRPSCCASTPGAAGVLLWIRKWSRIKRPRNAIRNALRIAPIACAPP